MQRSDDPIHYHWAPIMLALAPPPACKNRHQLRGGNIAKTLFSPATPTTTALFNTMMRFGCKSPGFNPNCIEPVYGCSLLQCLLHRGMFQEAFELITVHGADVNCVSNGAGAHTRTSVSSIPPLNIALQVSLELFAQVTLIISVRCDTCAGQPFPVVM